ncbi:theronine dehydrogenase [Sinorhizobium meliloti]|uniref:theronine dehydrogenase n=1 Tax=Rhizobium meliloti TaxID=382 RepID=UPI000FDAAB1C|nr:theronine dehydrogenase [Sinorhizobium meliloti]RVK75437.1 theronine dehydrogenase [Sinorhizobium meliloti]
MTVEMARYSLAWRRPDLPPPGPRVLKAMMVPRGDPCPPEIMELWKPGAGYSIGWELVTQQPIRRWSQAAKANARVRNLRRRMEQRYPLFADMFIQAELERRPAYYAAEDERI